MLAGSREVGTEQGTDRPHRSVSRRRLVDPAMALPATSVVTVVAPWGGGKSQLLRQLAARSMVRAVTITLTPANCSSVSDFAGIIVEALGLTPARVFGAERSDGIPSVETRARSVAAATVRMHLLILFDDVHHLTDPDAIHFLGLLLRQPAPHTTYVLAGHTLPKLRLARVAIEGRLHQIGTEDLNFDRVEARALAAGTLKAAQVDSLHAAVFGWPLGVAAGLRDQANPATGTTSLQPARGGQDGSELAHLADQVVAGLGSRTRQVLADIATVAPLPSHVLAGLACPDYDDQLAELIEHPVPMIRVSRDSRTIQVGGPLTLALERHPDVNPSDHRSTVLRKVQRQCEADGDFESALVALDLLGDADALAAFILREAPTAIWQGRLATVDRWLSSFPPEAYVKCSALHLANAMSASARYDFRTAARALEQHHSQLVAQGRQDSPEAKVANLLREASGQFPLGSISRGFTSELTPFRLLALYLEGFADVVEGDLVHAEAVLTALGGYVRDLPLLDIMRLGMLAFAVAHAGRRDQAWGLVRESVSVRTSAGLSGHDSTTLTDAVRASLLASRGRHIDARTSARPAQAAVERAGTTAPAMRLLMLLCLLDVALLNGDYAAADELSQQARATVDISQHNHQLQRWLTPFLSRQPPAGMARSSSLSATELMVLRFLATPHGIPRIAEEMRISPNTVRTHARSIYRKLEAHSRDEAIATATARGLLTPVGMPAGHPGAGPPSSVE